MAAHIFSFQASRHGSQAAGPDQRQRPTEVLHGPGGSADWSQLEIAEFYRVEGALVQAGLALETDRGLTDEGDPWFAFCRSETGEVFIHFARIGGLYVVAGIAFPHPASGTDFRALVRDLVSRHPFAAPDALSLSRRGGGNNIFLHPAALLIAVVGAAFFHNGPARAADLVHPTKATSPSSIGGGSSAQAPVIRAPLTGEGRETLILDAGQAASIVAAVLISLDGNGVRAGASSSAMGLGEAARAPHVLGSDHSSLVISNPTFETASPVAIAPSTGSGGHGLSLSAMKAVIALTAVLSDLASSSANGAASAPSVEAPAYRSPGAAALALPVAGYHVGTMPELEAAEAARASGALSAGTMVRQIDHLPQVLVDLIDRGNGEAAIAALRPSSDTIVRSDTDVANGQLGQAAADTTKTNPTVPAALDAHLRESADASSAPADAPMTGDTPANSASSITSGAAYPVAGQAGPAPVSTAPTPTPAPAPVPAPISTAPAPAPAQPLSGPYLYASHDARVEAAVLHFASQSPKLDVVVSGHSVVLYDGGALITLPMSALSSVTFNFDDGSTISLVGTISELADSHVLR
jgi:hypothetical protein